ncbi:transcription initiation factor TFIID subunit 7-like [Ochotona princeps]|uniref:transcription initiation factor TFIID subunit 7-like n=1 Tax=Ochotona princeps TaxID=9978 RepID=UPI0027148BDF|nr:transcription initiation factor TFIID subunit 7-like [Ochotona princeps]
MTKNASGPVMETSSGPITETHSGPVAENASGLASGPSMEMEGPISKTVSESNVKTTGDQGGEILVDQGPPPATADASAQAAVQTPSENCPERTAMSKSKSKPPQELENQFILRVPPEYASTVRNIAHSRDVAAKNRLKIDLSSDLRRATVEVDKTTLPAKLVDLPCVVGSLKTFDKKNFHATADISQMLVCTAPADGQPQSSPEEPTTSADLDLTEKSERRKKKTYAWKHGITPPLKNVRKRRFRKITKKTADVNQFEEISFTEYVDSPEVEKEVKRLLCSDAEAVSARWEVISGGETKEIECQGSVPSFQMSLGIRGHKKSRDLSEYKLLPEMFDESSTDTETEEEKQEEEEEITVMKVVDKKREEEEEQEEDDDDEDEELIEDEEEDNEYEEALERELQTKLLESDMYESKEIITSLVMTIQKQMSFLEKKLFGIQWKIQRQKRLLTKVESLPLKTHLNSVLEKLKVEEKQRNEQLISLKENLRYVLQK